MQKIMSKSHPSRSRSQGCLDNASTSTDCKFGTFLLKRKIPTSNPTQKLLPLQIAYRIIRPSLLDNKSKEFSSIPLVVVHGGPSLPSEYLSPLAHNNLALKNRSIIFYDQLGCGWSSIPQQDEFYGVPQMGMDLKELMCHLKKEWKVDKFHLMGHSLGGAIGYEYLKLAWRRNVQSSNNQGRNGDLEKEELPQCLSFILSNASTDFALADSERDQLYSDFIVQQHQTQHQGEISMQKNDADLQMQFFQTHICRTSAMPNELQSALNRRGKVWSSKEYQMMPCQEPSEAAKRVTCTNHFPPVMIIRGKYDFVTEACTRSWGKFLNTGLSASNFSDFQPAKSPTESMIEFKEVLMNGCAHYPHFEQPVEYARLIEEFCMCNHQP